MKIIKYIIKSIFLLAFIFISINVYILLFTSKYIYTDEKKIPKAYTAIVLGAHVWRDGRPSLVLRDRLNALVLLYKNNKINKVLLSGDHGQKDYDEVNSMKNYLIQKGIPSDKIFLDHAGFDTYSTMKRAKDIFLIEDAIVVTHDFHLPRAVFLALKNNIKASGFSIKGNYAKSGYYYYWVRERLASIKAFFDIIRRRKPKYSGKKIPITGNNKASWD
ncbi:MAG: YdcF family protein [Fusobacteriaceae bacterium]|jgi:SanA protein|nr:YdcF family protein [Fusobacteriaceae bacterium]